MHNHNPNPVPAGYIEVMSHLDEEDWTFSTTLCVEGMHVSIEFPVDHPHALSHMLKALSHLPTAFFQMLVVAMMDSEEMANRVNKAMENWAGAEELLEELKDVEPDKIVDWLRKK